MKITICGSMTHESLMSQWAKRLSESGYEVAMPNLNDERAYTADSIKNATLKRGLMDKHFRKIDDSDAILVVNGTKNDVKNYIGGNTLIEIAYAYAQGLEIFLLNSVPEVSYRDEIDGMHPIVIHNDIKNIDDYFAALPLVMVSSESVLKHRSVSRGLRRAGVRVKIDGIKVDSGVNEQPRSIDEAYDGALNRQQNLIQLVQKRDDVDYIATIESGYHQAHKNHNGFGCTVVVIERKGGTRKVGIDLDVEFPKSMTDKIPSKYPDVGVLVQKEYGALSKDPFPYFTNNKLNRTKIMENAVYNVIVQFSDAELARVEYT
jgi:non-canonical (house-cleaning) NTP pyrophosphatase